MTKFMKKTSSVFLALVMMFVMMPATALCVNAADGNVFNVYANGVDTGKGVTASWMEENKMEAQVFPYAASQGKNWSYVVAEGPSYEAVLCETLGISSLDEISDAALNWNNADGAEQGKFDLNVSDLMSLTDQFKLVDQNGNDITGAFNGSDYESAQAVAIEGAAEITPIVATSEHEYATYDEACNALADGSWRTGAATSIRPYVGGNLSKETFLKKDSAVKMGVVNFTGKFSMANLPQLNLKTPESLAIASMTLTSKTAKQVRMPFDMPDTVIETLYGAATWTSSDTSVATVDENGNVTAVADGTCTISGKTEKGNTIGKCKVTVNFPLKAPGKVYWYKTGSLANVKTRSMKLKWNTVSGATGYVVYRSTKKSSGFKKIATVKTNSYKNTKLKSGKTYYYKIKAYKSASGKSTVYGAYSSVIGKKVKK
ncbi:MAG: Ig-like domain-containing protein [Mogibacterium sp.]|nr:Ig-like domain-containing protein [Mogibacterium sp.]